jgi:hypothetical protein
MVPKIGKDHPLRRMFDGLVEQVFMTKIGICDPRLTEYLGALLSGFIHVDEIFCLRTVDGEVIREISRAEADACLGPEIDGTLRRRLINRYIGDFTLFWTGVYPESLRPRHSGVDRLHEYLLQGRRSYGIASELSTEQAEPSATLLHKLSEEFESCVHGLHLVRAGWRELDPASDRN